MKSWEYFKSRALIGYGFSLSQPLDLLDSLWSEMLQTWSSTENIKDYFYLEENGWAGSAIDCWPEASFLARVIIWRLSSLVKNWRRNCLSRLASGIPNFEMESDWNSYGFPHVFLSLRASPLVEGKVHNSTAEGSPPSLGRPWRGCSQRALQETSARDGPASRGSWT